MCRHLAYIGPPRPLAELISGAPHSLYEQSYTPTVNADGFGVGWYPVNDGAGPVRYRRAVPIWADANLPGLAAAISSGAVLAAVRSATPGNSYEESAVAPYALGHWLFSHHGRVDDWELLPEDAGEPLSSAELLDAEARCDAALLWIMTIRRLADGTSPGDALADVVRQTAGARPGARLNFLLTDGHTIAATRHGGPLWYHPAPGELTVATAPTSDDDGWREVPDHSLLLATERTTEIEPL
ncbi:ergothioneine biosynthesis protein EgtC [Streptomyces sp. NBC_01803]|uniref:ergothioneine biosynthesis protein EgtC n=1 Tax=Streptomyces sp. NBC_01803 TaxID=2975946 RepID=UPI002DDC677A|nr:ergothioneine biosynthesis protein EgtC [Streptomyces sp. NBC_01803]WSA44670.1 ergothioneine biosynthesis protein EgtC [Streptomyces sp. NBC_01803]